MEYQVPQFIEVEDKLVGPLTLKQFIYVAGAAGMCAVFFMYLNIVFALLFSIPVVGLALVLAFYKINGKPFIDILEAGFNYLTHSRLMIWKKDETQVQAAQAEASTLPGNAPVRPAPRLTRGKLSELAWSLDVKSRESKSTP